MGKSPKLPENHLDDMDVMLGNLNAFWGKNWVLFSNARISHTPLIMFRFFHCLVRNLEIFFGKMGGP